MTLYTLRYFRTSGGWELRPEPLPDGPLDRSDLLPFVRSNIWHVGIAHLEGADSPILFFRRKSAFTKRAGNAYPRLVPAYQVDLPFDFMTREIEARLRKRDLPHAKQRDWRAIPIETARRILLEQLSAYGISLDDGVDVRAAVPAWQDVFKYHDPRLQAGFRRTQPSR